MEDVSKHQLMDVIYDGQICSSHKLLQVYT